ncbi:exodeoxyribonuclease III [bacterium]|nr:exodeoxyribonuclease III [bacterium]
MPITIASWNINSVRLRMPLVAQMVQQFNPDVLCLQEIKCEDMHFPLEGIKALGYEHVMHSGEKSYNGVAILSRLPLKDMETINHAGTNQKRHIAATLPDGTRLHNLYIPAGGDIPDVNENPKFKMKLDVLDALSEWSDKLNKDTTSIILGDFNIAPLEHDVWSHKQLLDVVSHTPIEVEKLTRLQHTIGWVDSVREFIPHHEKAYSWWSYRARDWDAADKGRRLDHVWLSPALKPQLKAAHMPRAPRGWTQPSDHVPVLAVLEG